MKMIINFFKKGFQDLDYSYYEKMYEYEGKLCMGYVIIRKFRIFWIPGYERIIMCGNKKDLEENLKFLKENLVK
jgi:hypothetical protein